MILPKNNGQLDALFKEAAEPDIEEFNGEYWVNMLTGSIANFRWAGHRKRFFKENGIHKGINLVLWGIPFGTFSLEKSAAQSFKNLICVMLNYDKKKNILTRSIVDKVRKINESLYLGRYYYRVRGGLKFKGYFSLTRRKK